MTDSPGQFVPLCDTDGCDRAATNQSFGGFHFCDIHTNDKAGRNDSTRPMTLRLPVELHEHYRQQAFDLRTSMSALIIAALYTDAQTVGAAPIFVLGENGWRPGKPSA